MKVYHFSLGTVMRIRALEERLAREHLMLAQRELRRAQGVYQDNSASLAALAVPTGVTTMGQVRWIGDQAGRIFEEVQMSREAMVAAASTREEASRSWHVARKRLGTLERLNVQGLARWKDEVRRQEVAELDDLANTRHGLIGVRL